MKTDLHPGSRRLLVWRPIVLVTLAYVFLLSLFWLWLLLTLRADGRLEEMLLSPRFGTLSLHAILSGVHLVLGALLLAEFWRQLRSGSMDRTQVVGLVLTLVLVVAVQWGTEELRQLAQRIAVP